MTASTPTPDTSREAILDAAERLFAERGFNGASVQDIASAAGVSRGTPSYFFGSKRGLYEAVLDRAFEALRDLIAAAALRATSVGRDFRGLAEELIGDYVDFLVEHPSFVRLLQWESLAETHVASGRPSQVEGIREGIAILAEALPGADERTDLAQLLISAIGLCWFPYAHRDTLLDVLGLDPTDPAFVEARKRHVVALLSGALPGPDAADGKEQ